MGIKDLDSIVESQAVEADVYKRQPPYCSAVGNPCRVVRKRFDDETIAFLLDLKWWDWDAEKIFGNMELLCNCLLYTSSKAGGNA